MSLRRLALVSLLFASAALADIAPPDTFGCASKTAGAACTKDDGTPGVCVASTVRRPDYSTGIPPKTKEVQMLTCTSTATAMARVPMAIPWAWLAAVLAAAVMSATLFLVNRHRRPTA